MLDPRDPLEPIQDAPSRLEGPVRAVGNIFDRFVVISGAPVIAEHLADAVRDRLDEEPLCVGSAGQVAFHLAQPGFRQVLVIAEPTCLSDGELKTLIKVLADRGEQVGGVLFVSQRKPMPDEFQTLKSPILRVHGYAALEQVLEESALGRFPPGTALEPAPAIKDESPVSAQFTKRETDVLAGIIQGWRNREIARELGIAESTVRGYLSSIFDKTGVRSKHGLVVGFSNLDEILA